MGATIAPPVLAVEPRYRALVLSGAGGSWIENVICKQSPLEVRPIAESMLGYAEGELTAADPFLSMLQWAGEAADPPAYGDVIVDQGQHVLMLQGIVDTYILPPIANATTLSIGLDLAGPALDADHPDLAEMRGVESVLGYAGRKALDLPAGANRVAADGSAVTALVVQHAEDGVQDGHEVAYQLDAAREQLQCFLADLAAAEAPEVGRPDCP